MGDGVDGKDRLIERIELADDRFLRLTAATGNNPLQSVDLTMRQLRALLLLSYADGASGSDLAEALGVGLAAVTGLVNRLATRGLVHRTEDPHDRRIRRVYLTDTGIALVAELRDAGRDHKRRLLHRLTNHQLRQMAEAMDALNTAAEADRTQPQTPRTPPGKPREPQDRPR